MTLLFLYLALALGVSFLCSLLESVILSVPQSHIQLMIKEKKRGGKLLKSQKDQIDKPLAAILTLNTIAHTIGAAGVGAEVQKIYGNESVALGSGVLTFLILILSEIIPKTLGASQCKPLAPFSAYIIRILIVLTYPFVMFSKAISKLISPSQKGNYTMSREEMIVAAETGHEEGVLAEKEQRIIKNLLRLQVIRAQDVMTPRSVIFTFHKDTTVGDAIEKHKPIFFSRIPVYDENIDHVVGMVLRFKILEAYSNDHDDWTMDKFLMPIHSVSEDMKVGDVLDEFIRLREHLFIVTEPHGGTAGIITLEDVIETLLGVEIVDEFDSVEDMRKFALEQWENRKKSRKYKHLGQEDE